MHINKLWTNLRRNLGTILLLMPVLFILFGYALYPSIRVLWQSFSRAGEYSLKNYAEFFHPAVYRASPVFCAVYSRSSRYAST